MQNVTRFKRGCELVASGACGVQWEVLTTDFEGIYGEWLPACESDWIYAWSMRVQMIGLLVGASVAGQCADTFGRGLVMIIITVLLTIIGAGTAFITSPMQMIVTRCVG